MSDKPIPVSGGKFFARTAGMAILLSAWALSFVPAQSVSPAPVQSDEAPAIRKTEVGGSNLPGQQNAGVVQAGCNSCGGGLFGAPPPDAGGYPMGGCSDCCGNGCRCCCYAGRYKDCDCCCNCTSCCGKFFGGLYECLCCPDPCYEPCWIPAANAAFFSDAARPVTQTRWRYDAGWDYRVPDRAEFFYARQRTNPLQQTVDGTTGVVGKGPTGIARKLDYDELSFYSEGAVNGFGMFIEMPYHQISPYPADVLASATILNPKNTVPASGFGDLTIGTKSLFLDCELIQLTFQFKTMILSGNFTKGLGTGHVSLEPGLLTSIKCTSDCYVQAATQLWIPVGGDSVYQGNVWHNHISINKILCMPCRDFQIIGTAEINEWTVLNGHYTSPDVLIGGNPVAVDAATGIVSMGPGIRFVLCDKYDLGVGSAFSITGDHWAKQLARGEFRWRF